jgi:hypothetical protein
VWRVAYEIETLGSPDSQKHTSARHNRWIGKSQIGKLGGNSERRACFDFRLQRGPADIVQLGGIYTHPPQRSRLR